MQPSLISILGGTVLVFEPSAYCRRQSARTGPRREEHDNAGGDFSATDGSDLSGVGGIGTHGQLSVRPYHGAAFFSTAAVADAAKQGFQGR
jgi:hypothetical protein